jgi:parallel beta-helix repeat protein
LAERNPVAFMSYLHRVDQHDRGRLTELRERLEGEVQLYTGEEDFAIFQDRKDIRWGQQWQMCIEDSLNDITFLIPIITPGFFGSKPCRDEIELFLERERKLGRSDLILPIYYIDYPDFNDEERRRRDPLMVEIAKHQYEDWRDLRHESLTSAAIGRRLSKLAETLRDALDRRRPAAAPEGSEPPEIAESQQPPTPEQAQPAEGTAAQSLEEGGAAAASTATAKPEPPTLVVDPLHRGDHTSITAAIAAAEPGTVIAVKPGLYQEGLVIDKPLEIIGQGAVDEVVIEVADKNVILSQATMGRIASVSLRQLEGQFFAVDITRGRLDLEDCDITSQGLGCVAIRGGADPRLRRNRIHDGKNGGGVFVNEQGRGTVEDNEIFANALAGVEIKTGGDPVLSRNRIHDGKSVGVFINEQGRGTVEDNEIFANALAGVRITTGGDPVVRRNRITQNGYEAIWVNQGGGGTFEDNDLRGNERGPWGIAKECEGKVTRRNNQE